MNLIIDCQGSARWEERLWFWSKKCCLILNPLLRIISVMQAVENWQLIADQVQIDTDGGIKTIDEPGR